MIGVVVVAIRYSIRYHTYPAHPGYTAISKILAYLCHNFYLVAIQFVLVLCLVINLMPSTADSTFVELLLIVIVPIAAAILYCWLLRRIERIVNQKLDAAYPKYVKELSERDPEKLEKLLRKHQRPQK